MQTVIYADVLFVINSVITFLILITTADITKVHSVKARYISGAFSGGLLSFILFAPEMKFIFVILIRLIISILIILITFRLNNVIQFVKCTSGFFLISFLYAGIVYSLSNFFNLSRVYYNNGYAYFDFSAMSLIVITTVIFLIIRLVNRKIFIRNKNDDLFAIRVVDSGREAEFSALYDTGNSIRDIYNGRPVIITSIYSIESLLSAEKLSIIKKILEKKDISALPQGIRLIPVKTIGADNLLPAFTAESAIVSNDEINISVHRVCIAVTEDNFGDNKYTALINDSVFGKV